MIYATPLSSPRGKYNPRVRAGLAAAGLVLMALAAAGQTRPQWREAPEYLQPFAPAGDRASRYRAFVSDADIETVLKDSGLAGTSSSGMWIPVPTTPADAFGQAGRYDRSAVARLYGSMRARVARGVTMAPDGTREYWTLVSPHPDPALRRLERGTLLLVLRYDGAVSDR
jgi:hypothetical protein